MRDVDARVTGFDYTTFHVYRTEVAVDGRTWTLNLRYNTFYQFYERLVAIEKYFTVAFPPKGGLFFSPAPEERQEQLDEFISSTLVYFEMRRHPKRMEALLNELLQIPEHFGVKGEEEEERTASEGSLEEHEVYLESGHEDRNHTSQLVVRGDHRVRPVVKVDNQGFQSVIKDEVHVHDAVGLETKAEAVEANKVKPQVHTKNKLPDGQHQLTSSTAATEDLTIQRSRMLDNRAVSTRREKIVDTSKAAKVERSIEEQQSVKKDKVMEVEVEMQQKGVANLFSVSAVAALAVEKKTTTREELVEATSTQATTETTAPSTEPEEHVLKPVAPIESDHGNVPARAIELDAVSILAPQVEEKPVEERESFLERSEEPDLEPCNKDTEPENPMVGWFRRIVTFSSCSDRKVEQEAPGKREEEEAEKETVEQVENEATTAEACMIAKEEAKAKVVEAELLLAAQRLNLRLKRYRHPVFFQSFNCAVGTSRFSLSQWSSVDVFV